MRVSGAGSAAPKINLFDHEILIGKVLGHGSFAQVFQGLWNETAVAVKAIEYNRGARGHVDPLLEAVLSKCAPLHCPSFSQLLSCVARFRSLLTCGASELCTSVGQERPRAHAGSCRTPTS